MPSFPSRLVFAIAASLLFAAVAWGQTPDQPMHSNFQIVAGSGSAESFLVDPGASRVVVDVRQLAPTDTCEITDPTGLPLSRLKRVEYPVGHEDLSASGDFLGNYEDMIAWDLPDAGEHVLSSDTDFLALVRIEGGADMSFWIDGLRADHSIPEDTTFTLRVTLQDGLGLPLDSAAVTATIRSIAKKSGGTLGKTPWSTRVQLVRERPGQYAATLVGGIPKKGPYHIDVTAEQDFVRRQVASSFNVGNGCNPPAALPALAAPLEVISLPDDQEAQSAGVEAQSTGVAVKSAAFPGQIFVGPEDRANPIKPVVVFLHGWNSDTAIWDRPDGGFWHAALEANYRVASVGLHPDQDFNTNGAIVDHALSEIARVYDVRKVVVVAHSKGGVDLDASLMFGTGADHVVTVITLSTPHFGTPLADLVSALPSWLVGTWQNPAQESMEIASMAAFRCSVLGNPNNARVDIRTIGAWGYDEVDWDGTAIELVYKDITGPILKQLVGDNDGIVPYVSSVRPQATTIFGGKPDSRTEVNHAQIRERNHYWRHIQAQLLTASYDNTPSPPANVTAELTDATAERANVTLHWENNSRFADTLRVERSVDGAPFEEIASVPVISYPVYVDVGVAAGHTYAYRLRFTISWQFVSDYSNQASVSFASPVPSAPINLTATATSPTSIRLNWVDTSGNETGFEIYRRVNGANQPWAFIATVSAGAQQTTDNGVGPVTSYQYQVRAVNGPYASPYSNLAGATTPDLPLVAPSNLAGTYNGTTNRVTLTWRDNSSNEQGVALQMSYSGGTWSNLNPATVGPNVTTYVTGTFPPQYGWYSFRVRAFRDGVTTAWSNVAQVYVAPPPPAFLPPSNLTGVYSSASNRVTLNWTDNSGNEDGFALQLSYGGTIWSDLYPATVGPNTVSYTTGTFPPQYGIYSFRVRAFRGSETTAWSNVAQVGVFP